MYPPPPPPGMVMTTVTYDRGFNDFGPGYCPGFGGGFGPAYGPPVYGNPYMANQMMAQ